MVTMTCLLEQCLSMAIGQDNRCLASVNLMSSHTAKVECDHMDLCVVILWSSHLIFMGVVEAIVHLHAIQRQFYSRRKSRKQKLFCGEGEGGGGGKKKVFRLYANIMECNINILCFISTVFGYRVT